MLFLTLGLVMHIAMQLAFPAPKPVLGPPDESRIGAMVQNYAKFSREPLSPELMAKFVDAELRDELLFREALDRNLHLLDPAIDQRMILNMRFLDSEDQRSDAELIEQAFAMRLHLSDEVVRRRLVQVMEQLILSVVEPAAQTEKKILERFERNRTLNVEPTRFSFIHVFLPEAREHEMPAMIARIDTEQLTPENALRLGASFISGFEFGRQSASQLSRVFGDEFVAGLALAQIDEPSWVGPVRSAFGLHYVYLREIIPARERTLEELREGIERSLMREAETEAVARWVEQAMTRYEVKRS